MAVIFLRVEEIILRVISRIMYFVSRIVYPVSLAREGIQRVFLQRIRDKGYYPFCVPSLAQQKIMAAQAFRAALLSFSLCPFPCLVFRCIFSLAKDNG